MSSVRSRPAPPTFLLVGCREGVAVQRSFKPRFVVCPKGLPLVLFDIVKRRFVRTPQLECGPQEGLGLFAGSALKALVCRGETLNLPPMMG